MFHKDEFYSKEAIMQRIQRRLKPKPSLFDRFKRFGRGGSTPQRLAPLPKLGELF